MTAPPATTNSWSDQRCSDRLQRVRLCAIDVDGTLLNSAHQVAAETTEAVNDARRRGLAIVLATSRAPSALKPVLTQIPSLAHEVFIGSQGAITACYRPDGQLAPTTQQAMPLQSAHAVVTAAIERGISVSWYSGEH